MPLIPLAQASRACGTKARHLGRLIRTGFRVPGGFVVTDPLGDASWVQEIAPALRVLGPGPFAVRSSGLDEDGGSASFAGQLTSVLGVLTPGEVIDAVRRSAASGSTAMAGSYAARTGRDAPMSVSVLVQLIVQSDVAGVLFTRHPTTGAAETVINAARGLGEPVVAGTVTPDTYIVRGSQVEVTTAHQVRRLDFRDGHLVTTPLHPGDDQVEPVLTTAQALDLADAGRRIENLFGQPQDIEWAITEDTPWILQARPITTRPDAVSTETPVSGDVLLAGIAASPGTATGPVRVITGLDDFTRFGAGDVLVCRTTSPAWTPLLARAGAVVTETGGILAHAAIVAREFGIPAVLAAHGATTILHDSRAVRVDGTRGHVSAHPTDH